MRHYSYFPLMLMVPAITAQAQVSVSIGLPHLNIGINVATVPELVPVPDSPVYYAPGMNWNYFFYDGMYWVFKDDNWYASSWYNGPWAAVHPEAVPDFMLRVPVRYYRQPPSYFRGWQREAPPRWGDHWGSDWAQRRPGWDRGGQRPAPPPAPLPTYQKNYRGAQYPPVERQHEIHTQNYPYHPQDRAVREHYAVQEEHRRSGPEGR